MSEIKIQPVSEEIQQIEISDDGEGGLTAVIYWRRKGREVAKVLEFEWGPQGTWLKLLLSNGDKLCITQSATMEPSSYLVVGEEYPIPEEPMLVEVTT